MGSQFKTIQDETLQIVLTWGNIDDKCEKSA